MTTILVCYKHGTLDILKCCLSSIKRYTNSTSICVFILKDKATPIAKAEKKYCDSLGFFIKEVEIPTGLTGSRVHGSLLDNFISKFKDEICSTDYVMTLDSDCFPIDHGWLSKLTECLQDGDCGGILHPWAPPPSDTPRNSLEWRVRSQHCWETTHVACQVMTIHTFSNLWEKGVRFSQGDDTGLMFPNTVKKNGGKCVGLKPTRCAITDFDINPEFNRYLHVVYGDLIYHRGGFTRKDSNNESINNFFPGVDDTIRTLKDASFLLYKTTSYQYKFNREEEVALDHLNRSFGLTSTWKENADKFVQLKEAFKAKKKNEY